MTRSTLEHSAKGGMERHADIVCRGLIARGHRITAITTQHPEDKTETLTPGIRTLFLPYSADRAYAAAWWRASADAFDLLHRTDPVDLIWSQENGAYGALSRSAKASAPCVAILHGTPFGDWRGKRREWGLGPANLPRMARFTVRTLLFHRRFRTTCRRADAVICVSPQLAEDAMREFGVEPDKVVVVPNGVDTARFAPNDAARQALRSRLGISDDDFAILTSGRLERAKGHHLALKVAAALGEEGYPAQVIVAGGGPDEDWLRDQAQSPGIAGRVHWLGYVPHEEMPGVYNAADAVLMLSLHTEAFPYAVVEAMSCARPVVASRIGGIPSAVTDGKDGILVPVGGGQAAVEQMRLLLQNRERRAAIGQAARQTVLARFTLDTMIADTETVFLRCAGRAREASR